MSAINRSTYAAGGSPTVTGPDLGAVDHDLRTIVSRRRAPSVYVLDARGIVLFRHSAGDSLGFAARSTAMRLIASHPHDEVMLGLAPPDDLIRMVRLNGSTGNCYALFVEKVARRCPVEAACSRYGLSDRERSVLPHLLRGATTHEIAAELMIAESTVATHVRNIGAKMDASKRKEIVAAVLGSR